MGTDGIATTLKEILHVCGVMEFWIRHGGFAIGSRNRGYLYELCGRSLQATVSRSVPAGWTTFQYIYPGINWPPASTLKLHKPADANVGMSRINEIGNLLLWGQISGWFQKEKSAVWQCMSRVLHLLNGSTSDLVWKSLRSSQYNIMKLIIYMNVWDFNLGETCS
jgi:hypothetical protein